MIQRYLTIILLAWLANECACCCAMASVALPDNEQIPNQELILPEGIPAWSNEPFDFAQSDLLSYLPTRKFSSVSGVLDGQSVGITYEYDQQLNTLKITDELGRVVEGYALDVNGRPTVVTNILGQTMQVTYALLDLPQQIRRFDNSSVSYAYDAAWRPKSIVYPDDVVTQRFSAGGMLLSVGDQTSGTILNKYDVLSRWAGQTCPALGGAGPYEIAVVNGLGGLPESLTSIGGTMQYACDIGSRLSSISGPANTFNYTYNPTNGLISGVSCSAVSVSHVFDLLDRVTDIAWKDSSDNLVRDFDYSYNVVGMITQKVTTLNGQRMFLNDSEWQFC